MTDIAKIEKHLRCNSNGEGITVAKLVKLTGVPKSSIYKRIHDLHSLYEMKIEKNYRKVNGGRKLYYRIAS